MAFVIQGLLCGLAYDSARRDRLAEPLQFLSKNVVMTELVQDICDPLD